MSGVGKPLPCLATCVSGSLPYFLTVDVLAAFLLESMARMILSGCFRHAMEYINNNNAYTQLALFHALLQLNLTGQLNLFTVRLHHNIIKGPSLNE